MYQNIETLEVLSLANIQSLYKNTSFPLSGPNEEWLTENGYTIYIQPDTKPTQEQIISSLTSAVQRYLDDTVRVKNYDSILSACTYSTSSIPQFKAEGQACIEWRDACWSKCYSIIADVNAGLRSIPTEESIVSEMPSLIWP
jgi:hypothetical protein